MLTELLSDKEQLKAAIERLGLHRSAPTVVKEEEEKQHFHR